MGGIINLMIDKSVSYPKVCRGQTLKYHYWDEKSFDRLVNEIFVREQYGYPFADITLGNVIDLGANIGMFSAWIYDRADRIYAIEPYTKNYECLEANVRENGLDKVSLHKVAIYDTVGQVDMYTPKDPLGTKIIENPKDIGGLETVDCTTLINFLDDNKIEEVDLLKVDIEGAEFKIFTDQAIKEFAPRISRMIGEHNNSETFSALRAGGYEVDRVENKPIWWAKRK